MELHAKQKGKILSKIQKQTPMKKTTDVDYRKEREMLLSVLNDLEDGYYEVDLNGDFTFFNDPMCKLTGYIREELNGMNNRQYMSRESAKAVLKNFNRVYTTGESVKGLEFEIIQKQGENLFVEGSISLIFDRTNISIGRKDPLEYMKDRYKWTSKEIVSERLQSHLIPINELANGGYEGLSDEQKGEKLKNDFAAFISCRAELVIKAVK